MRETAIWKSDAGSCCEPKDNCREAEIIENVGDDAVEVEAVRWLSERAIEEKDAEEDEKEGRCGGGGMERLIESGGGGLR